jgi:hypothetical protein
MSEALDWVWEYCITNPILNLEIKVSLLIAIDSANFKTESFLAGVSSLNSSFIITELSDSYRGWPLLGKVSREISKLQAYYQNMIRIILRKIPHS